jgi:hypothetical protein
MANLPTLTDSVRDGEYLTTSIFALEMDRGTRW